MGSLPLRVNRPTHIMLTQVFTCVTIFGLASSAPVDPFTAAAAATVGYLGQTAGTAAIGAAGAGTGLLLKKLVTGDGSFPRLNLGVSPVAELGSVRLGGKVGAGLGGLAPGSWYEPLSDDETLLFQGQLGFGVGETNIYGGVGAGLNYGSPSAKEEPAETEEPVEEEEEGKIISSEIISVGEWVPTDAVKELEDSSSTANNKEPFLEFATGGKIGPIEGNVGLGF